MRGDGADEDVDGDCPLLMTSLVISTPPSLDLACPQAEADNDKYVQCLEVEASIKIKYRHEGIMIILITATYIDIVI